MVHPVAMRSLRHISLVVVTLAVALLSCVPVTTALTYNIVQVTCAREGFQLFCSDAPRNNPRKIYDLCRSANLYLSYVTSTQEFSLVSSLMNSQGITRAYLGGYNQYQQLMWTWMADGWSFTNSSVFYEGSDDQGGFVYGTNFWRPSYPTSGQNNFVQMDVANASNSGFINVGGGDVNTFYIICESEPRTPPKLDSAPEAPPIVVTTTTTATPVITTTTTPIPTVAPKEKKEFPIWAIGIIVDAVLLVIIIVVVCVLCYCCKKKANPARADTDSISDHSENDDNARSFRSD